MDNTKGIQQGFSWLARLNPLKPHKLFASVSIGDNSGSFSDDNWDNINAFAAKFSPDRNAVIVIQRTEESGSKTLMGMICRDGEWMQTPANLLLGIDQVNPDLKTRTATPDVSCADITSIYPDCPATVLTQENTPSEDEDEEESEEDHNPAHDPIPKGAVTHSRSTDAQIAERGRISSEIDDIFNWLATLNAAKDHLHCTIYTGVSEQHYSKENWDALPYADCSAISADVVIVKIETLPDGTEKSTIMGLAHYGKKWQSLTKPEMLELSDTYPEAFDWVARMQNPTYSNIKDIYPDCPI